MLAQAPDQQSSKAARRLTNLRTWSELGCTDSLVFGKCQGSGKRPYQVTVDITGPAYQCTCPSRKFPCKHGLALLLLWAEHGDAVGEVAQAADHASDWASERAARASRRASRAARRREESPDPEAQARRQAEREAKMSAGFDELERWLGDLVRQGLAAARRQPPSFWENLAARMVDAQMPALADRVRDAGTTLLAGPDWAEALLAEVGRWQLALRAWRGREHLGPAVLADLRAYVGWPRRPDELDGFERQADRWVVVGVRQGRTDRILNQRTWLQGQTTGRWAVLLDFAAAGGALQTAQVVGSVVEDELSLYPGSDPPRAALSDDRQVVGTGTPPASTTISETIDGLSAWFAANPWRERLPVVLREVVPVDDAGGWWLQDRQGDRLRLASAADPWVLLALTAGHPATVAAEWDAGAVHPLAVTSSATSSGEPVPL